jgi:hypothetical protein
MLAKHQPHVYCPVNLLDSVHCMPLYLVAIPLTFFNEWVAEAIYVGVALMWLVPDRRSEKALEGS